MLTGDIRNQVDRIWDAFWSGGISNPLEVADGAQNWIARQVKGATFREITLGRLRELPVAIPPPVQQTFATRVAAVETLKAAHRASLTHLDNLFTSLQHRAFRGEL